MLMIPYYVRREMINFELHFLGVRVRLPRAGLPHGALGCIPSQLRPSPPPCGCVFGFCAVPRTVGLMPIRRLRPALPITSSLCAIFDTLPTVAWQTLRILRTSPDESFM